MSTKQDKLNKIRIKAKSIENRLSLAANKTMKEIELDGLQNKVLAVCSECDLSPSAIECQKNLIDKIAQIRAASEKSYEAVAIGLDRVAEVFCNEVANA